MTDIRWHTDGEFHFAYEGPIYSGYWVRYDGETYGLHLENKPRGRFSQLAHAKEAAESDLRRAS